MLGEGKPKWFETREQEDKRKEHDAWEKVIKEKRAEKDKSNEKKK